MNWKYKSALIINIGHFMTGDLVEQLVHTGRKVNVFNFDGYETAAQTLSSAEMSF